MISASCRRRPVEKSAQSSFPGDKRPLNSTVAGSMCGSTPYSEDRMIFLSFVT